MLFKVERNADAFRKHRFPLLNRPNENVQPDTATHLTHAQQEILGASERFLGHLRGRPLESDAERRDRCL